MSRQIKHICLAEDDADDHYLFWNVLHEADSDVKLTWFKTCEELLDYLEKGTDLPDLIVLDMNMPKMNGHACLTKIKEELQLLHIPVIILSTTDQPAIMNKAYEAGALKYYQKPISLTAFKKIVKEILATPIEH